MFFHDEYEIIRPEIVYVVIYRNYFLEQFAIKGIFFQLKKAEKLIEELTTSASKDAHYDIEEWELDMTKIESNVRGIIKNLEKEINKLKADLKYSSTGEHALITVLIEDKQDIVNRLQAAVCSE